jgi:signal transduction histidine kinase
LRHWKSDARLKKIPFIVYTATYTEAEDERLALNLGADAFILKPAEPEDFMQRLRAVQDKVAAAEPVEVKMPQGNEHELLKVYSETLIRKLEEKTLQLEETNKALERDIAERKKIEAQLLRAQRMESIGTLAGGIAHDLNNLLAPIVMGVDLLRFEQLSPGMREVVDTIERSARRGTDLVKQVLSFARGIEGARVAVHLGHIIREIESIAMNTFPKNIRVETEVARDLCLIQGDPTQLNQVVLNFAVNARDAMPAGGTVRFSAQNCEIDTQFAAMNGQMAPGRYVLLAVSDTGCGIKPEVVERIFEPFFTTKEVGRGTGLGLSTVLGIVRSHAGFVNVESEVGKGSTFKVYLPAQSDTGLPVGPAAALAELPRGDGETILVVDDEASILTITKQTLESFGYKVLTAEDGAQAMGVYAMNREGIDLVLTDVMMPVMDGVVLINALRRIEPKVKVVAASGFDSKAGALRVAGVGIQEMLAKPYTAETMLVAVRKALDA